MRALWVLNPRSRRGRQPGTAVCETLHARGVELVEDTRELGSVDAIVVAGGDGTIAGVIQLALKFGLPLGVVPMGTFNDLARTLQIPFDIDEASAVIASRNTRTIDVARVNGVYYLNEASVGFSTRAARIQTASEKQRFGLLAIVRSALSAIKGMRPFNAEILFDGKLERLRTVQLTVANSNHFGGLITVEDAAIDDGWLDLYSVEIDNLASFLAVAGAVVAGRRRAARGLRSYRSATFEVVTHRPHRIAADGEPAGTTPARFEILAEALRIFVPAMA